MSGNLEVCGNPDGSVLLNLAVGWAGAPANEASYVEYVFSPAQADALIQALAISPIGILKQPAEIMRRRRW